MQLNNRYQSISALDLHPSNSSLADISISKKNLRGSSNNLKDLSSIDSATASQSAFKVQTKKINAMPTSSPNSKMSINASPSGGIIKMNDL